MARDADRKASVADTEQPSTSSPKTRVKKGEISDIILQHLSSRPSATITELRSLVQAKLGREVGSSSVRSFLNLNTPGLFERIGAGHYRLAKKKG